LLLFEGWRLRALRRPGLAVPQRFAVSARSCCRWATRRRAAPKRTSLDLIFTRLILPQIGVFLLVVSSSSFPRRRTPPCRHQTRATSHRQSATAQHVLRGDRFVMKAWRRASDGSWLVAMARTRSPPASTDAHDAIEAQSNNIRRHPPTHLTIHANII